MILLNDGSGQFTADPSRLPSHLFTSQTGYTGSVLADTDRDGDLGLVLGGKGDDVIFGGAGDDLLFGDLGNDTLTGGPGADIFFFHSDAGQDRVLDFNGQEGDRVKVEFGTYSVVKSGSDTVLDFGGGNQIILVGVADFDPGWAI